MKANTILIAILLLANAGFAQSVEAIQKRYAEIAEKARLCETDNEQGETGELVMNTLAINARNHQWRAVGIYQPTYKFFYRGGDSEKHPYPDQLMFVKTERRESNRIYREEYLYNDVGSLIFFFQTVENDESSPDARRYFFSAAKVIRIVEGEKARNRPTAKDTAAAKEVLSVARALQDLFNRSIKL